MGFDFKKDPFENFLDLYREAQVKGIPDPHAMSLATVNAENKPSVRIVYYKGMIRGGFSFFTNYNGRKAHDIEANPNVAVNFFWSHFDRQVRIEGAVQKTTREESEKYFATRARISQLGAWTSHQSEKLESFATFEKEFAEVEAKYAGKTVPCPPHWGGYLIEPREFEFWFGRAGRLHERYIYTKVGPDWVRSLRSP